MMTLDDAIKLYEWEENALHKCIPCDGCAFDKCKEEYRQLAEWLRELKAYREGCKCEDCKYQESKYCKTCYEEDSYWEYKGEVQADE